MAFRSISLRSGRRFLGIIALAIVFYNEFLVYKIQSLTWKSIPCQSGNCTRILLVADPQLIGQTFDTSFYNPIAIYDSDRYLKKTFREVLDHTRPHIIPFLGDLFDEGSVATNDEYSSYLRRFHDIFHTDSSIMNLVMKREDILLLFDVDGTLTPPRSVIDPTIESFLYERIKPKATIGIVGGADLEKMFEQLNGKKILQEFDYVFPENGLVQIKNGQEVGKESLISHLAGARGSSFAEYDRKHGVREKMIQSLREEFADVDLTYSIGGQISFDIFPRGWDKTYCLNFVEKDGNFKEIHFFGDKTEHGGNDYEIFSDSRTIGHKKIYVPGDNDIGGENGEIVTPTKINRFRSTFHTQHTYSWHNLVFFEANRITREIPQPATPPAPPYSSQRRFVLSHMSLLFYNDGFQERVLQYVLPHVIFTGHMHRSLFIRKSLKLTEFTRAHPLNANAERYMVNSFDLREPETFLEIMVPTCSYRMGERNIGFGYAVLDGDDLLYTVLWSVDRFSQLFLYLIYLLVCFIILTMKLIFTCSIVATRKLQRLRITYTKV
uniref:Phosphomannomutase n=2 Tax=Lutzomyia longipalpis TaxID=7200 RepID=A0A1B0CUQ9_LUTLO